MRSATGGQFLAFIRIRDEKRTTTIQCFSYFNCVSVAAHYKEDYSEFSDSTSLMTPIGRSAFFAALVQRESSDVDSCMAADIIWHRVSYSLSNDGRLPRWTSQVLIFKISCQRLLAVHSFRCTPRIPASVWAYKPSIPICVSAR